MTRAGILIVFAVAADRRNLQWLALWRHRRDPSDGDHLATIGYKFDDLLKCFLRNAIGSGQYENLRMDTTMIDGVRICKVQIVASRQSSGDEIRRHKLLHSVRDADVGRREACPRIIGWKKHLNLVSGLALAHQVAEPRKVLRHIGHDR